MVFPRLLYRNGAKGIEYQVVDGPDALDAATLDGWCLTRADALAVHDEPAAEAEAVDLSETHEVEGDAAAPRRGKGKGKGKAH